jgi:hypothetical protein
VSAIIVMITSLTVPPIKFVQAMQQLIGENKHNQSFAYISNGTKVLLPFWMLGLWQEQHSLVLAQKNWKRAMVWIQRQPTAEEWLRLLSYIPWKYDLPCALGGSIGIQFLAQFCLTEWLTSLHIDQMAAVLDHRLVAEFNGCKCFVGTEWSDILQSFFHSRRGEYLDSPSTQGLRHLAGEIVAGNLLEIATILPVFLPDEQTTVLLNLLNSEVITGWLCSWT